MAALAARVGICGDASDESLQIDVEKQAALDVVFAIVRKRMTPELVYAIQKAESHGTLEFEIEKGLGNIEKWFGRK